MKRFFLPTMVMVAGLACASCDESLSSITGPTPNLEPTFSSIQTNIFNMSDSSGRLACIQCHHRRGPSAGRGSCCLKAARISSLSGARAQETECDAGDSQRCRQQLYGAKTRGHGGHCRRRMPRGNGPFLTEGQMIVIPPVD
jgi:hypothetical protein